MLRVALLRTMHRIHPTSENLGMGTEIIFLEAQLLSKCLSFFVPEYYNAAESLLFCSSILARVSPSVFLVYSASPIPLTFGLTHRNRRTVLCLGDEQYRVDYCCIVTTTIIVTICRCVPWLTYARATTWKNGLLGCRCGLKSLSCCCIFMTSHLVSSLYLSTSKALYSD